MSPEWARIRAAFEEACGLEEAERERYLERLAGEDPESATEVRRLFASEQRLGQEFLEPPLPGALVDPESLVDSANPGDVVGDFTILRVLASGGMGTVYEARQRDPDRVVALKMLRGLAVSESARRRFRFETELLAKLRHPCIAQIYGAGMLDEPDARSTPWFAMELVEDARPITRFAQEHELDWRARVRLMIQVCDAVHHGHLRGVIHRDLKPANLLVDTGGHAKVIDFGVARLADEHEELTRAGELVGTLAAMSPEQVAGRPEDVDAKSDLYSLGVVLYQLLADRPPYDLSEASLAEATRTICETEPSLLEVPGAPRDLDWVVRRAMAKEPERRYSSAAELASDLSRLLDQMPVIAGPPTRVYVLKKFWQRHRLGVTSAAIAVLALVGGLLGVGVGWMRAADAERLAEVERARAVDEAALSNRVVEFLLEGLASPDPAADGRELMMTEFLDREAAAIDEGFGDRPRIRGALHQVVGRAYFGLGAKVEAGRHLEAAADAFREVDPVPEDELASVLQELALVRTDEASFDEAETHLEEASQLLDPSSEDSAVRAAVLQAREGRLLFEQGDGETAVPMLQNALTVLEGTPGQESEVAGIVSLLGGYHHQRGEQDPAKAAYDRALELFRELHDDEHPDVLKLKNNLAVLEANGGDWRRAASLLEEVMVTQERVLGPEHQDAVMSKNNLAGLLYLHGEVEDAAELWRESLPHLERALAPDHPATLAVKGNLGIYEAMNGDARAGYEMIREVLSVYSRTMGPTHERTLRYGFELARALVQLDEFEQAADWTSELEFTLAEHHGESHELFARVRLVSIEALLLLGRRSEARARLDDLEAGIATGRYSASDGIVAAAESLSSSLDSARAGD